ncbi:unnamed protein product [Symbiodinium natans]|uniref:Uncharacterized protein n=1 Tax=Symbiodinium natans TaxID=878477 RepID=A0A812P2Z4_9DINO|nr:unnamed protein product [Symbiodinium natans]
MVCREPGRECVASWPGKYESAWDSLVAGARQGEVSAAVVFLPDGTEHFGCHDEIPPEERLEGKCWCVPLYGEQKKWGCRWWSHWIANIETAVKHDAELQVFFFEGLTGQGKVSSFDTAGAEHLRREEVNSRRKGFMKSQQFKDAVEAGLNELSNEPRWDSSSPRSREVDRLFLTWLPAKDREFLQASEGLGNSQKAEVAWLERKGYSYTEVDVSTWLHVDDVSVPVARSLEPTPKAIGSQMGDLDAALECAEERLAVLRSLHDLSMEANAMMQLANLHIKDDNFEEAERLAKESHDLGKKDRNPRVQIDALLLQAQLLNTKVLEKPEDKAMKPFTDRAVRTVNEALQVAGKAENRGLRALVLFKRAETMVLAGRHQTGLRDVKEATGIFEEMDHYQALGRCLLLSGNIKHALGQEEAGAADVDRADFIAKEIGDQQLADEVQSFRKALEEKRLEKERAAQVQPLGRDSRVPFILGSAEVVMVLTELHTESAQFEDNEVIVGPALCVQLDSEEYENQCVSRN